MIALFLLAWIIFNGKITLEILLFGAVISAGMFLFVCKFMDHSLQKELRLYRLIPSALRYLAVLAQEILRANLTVCRMILTRKEIMEPVLVHVRTGLKSELARVVLANSITLTPGTITVAMTEDDLLVHCLDKSLAQGMEHSAFVTLLERMEREET